MQDNNNQLTTKNNNPFPVVNQPQQQASNALVEIEQSKAVAEVQAAMVIAKKFPRNQIEAMDRILNACMRPKLAETALYSYARGGTDITGPSIRLAEVIAQNWGNIQFGARELEQRNSESTMETFAWDIETNTRQVKTFQVKHTRHTKKGEYRLEDPRDIYENNANQSARRLRSCLLGIIPGDVIEAAVKQCEDTMKANADTSMESLKKLTEAFKEIGVTKEQIEKKIQCRIEAIKPAQIVSLRKIYQSLKDGMSDVSDWFEVKTPISEEKGNKGLKETLKNNLNNDENSTSEVDEKLEEKTLV